MLAAVLVASGVGVGIQGNPVCISGASPGRRYSAGQVYVQDTGDGPETIMMGSFPPGHGQSLYRHQIPLPASWLSFGYPSSWFGLVHRSSLSLGPGASGNVAVSVAIPAGARQGMYVVNLWAHTVAGTQQTSGGTVAVAGAGAATFLIIGVGQPVTCDVPLPAVPHQSAAQLAAAAQAMEAAQSAAARKTSWSGAAAGVAFVIGVLLIASGRRRR